MAERPILFSAPMVRALLAGTKTQTRRAVKLPHNNPLGAWEPGTMGPGLKLRDGSPFPDQVCIWHTRTGDSLLCPYGIPGDTLWVRETWCPIYPQNPNYNGGQPIEIDYAATPTGRMSDVLGTRKWKPSIHMPRALSRITLRITGVRAERLQDISEADAEAEGVEPRAGAGQIARFFAPYRDLWESINRAGSWELNPWVWVVSFQRAP